MNLVAALQDRRVLALADQMVVSAGTFLLTLISARVLKTEDFSQLSLTLLISLLLANVHRAAITQPANVLGATELEPASAARLTRSLALNAVLALGSAFIFVVIGTAVGISAIDMALGWVAFVAFSFQDTLRRQAYTQGEYKSALAISGLNQALLLSGFLVIVVGGPARREGFLVVVAASSALSAAWAMSRFGARPVWNIAQARAAWLEHRRTAYWLLLTVGAVWGTCQLQFLVGSAMDPVAAAFLAASRNILNIMGLLSQTIASYTPSRVTAQQRSHGVAGVRRLLHRYAIFTTVVSAGFLVAVCGWSGALLSALYGDQFRPAAPLLNIMAIAYVMALWGTVFGAFCTGLSDTKSSFLANVAGTAFSLTAGLWLISEYGLEGVGWSLTGSLAVATLTQAGFTARRLRRQGPSASAVPRSLP